MYKCLQLGKLTVDNPLWEVVIIAFPMALGLLKSMLLCPHPIMENKWAIADKHWFCFLSFFFFQLIKFVFSCQLLQATALTIVKMGKMSGFIEVHSHNHRLAIIELLFIDQERTLSPCIVSSTF